MRPPHEAHSFGLVKLYPSGLQVEAGGQPPAKVGGGGSTTYTARTLLARVRKGVKIPSPFVFVGAASEGLVLFLFFATIQSLIVPESSAHCPSPWFAMPQLRLRRICIALAIVGPLLGLLYVPLVASTTLWLVCLLAVAEHSHLRVEALHKLAECCSSLQNETEETNKDVRKEDIGTTNALKDAYDSPLVRPLDIPECPHLSSSGHAYWPLAHFLASSPHILFR